MTLELSGNQRALVAEVIAQPRGNRCVEPDVRPISETADATGGERGGGGGDVDCEALATPGAP
jgi:hypothetical protein